MLTLRVHSVLACAYLNGRRGRSVLPKNCLTHGVATARDFELVLCKVPAESLGDLDEPEEPSCPTCLRRFRSMLAKGEAERALFNFGDCTPVMTKGDTDE